MAAAWSASSSHGRVRRLTWFRVGGGDLGGERPDGLGAPVDVVLAPEKPRGVVIGASSGGGQEEPFVQTADRSDEAGTGLDLVAHRVGGAQQRAVPVDHFVGHGVALDGLAQTDVAEGADCPAELDDRADPRRVSGGCAQRDVPANDVATTDADSTQRAASTSSMMKASANASRASTSGR